RLAIRTTSVGRSTNVVRSPATVRSRAPGATSAPSCAITAAVERSAAGATASAGRDRKSTRLNSSHGSISYAVFCLKKKKHDVMGETAGLPSRQLPTRERGGAERRFRVALRAPDPRARPDRHLQPLVLRRCGDRESS